MRRNRFSCDVEEEKTFRVFRNPKGLFYLRLQRLSLEQLVDLVLGLLVELFGVERVVMAPLPDQFRVRAVLGDAAVLDNQDAVGLFDGRQPVGDDKAGPARHYRLHTLLDERFGQRIDRTGRLVHDKDFRPGQDGARQTD